MRKDPLLLVVPACACQGPSARQDPKKGSDSSSTSSASRKAIVIENITSTVGTVASTAESYLGCESHPGPGLRQHLC